MACAFGWCVCNFKAAHRKCFDGLDFANDSTWTMLALWGALSALLHCPLAPSVSFRNGRISARCAYVCVACAPVSDARWPRACREWRRALGGRWPWVPACPPVCGARCVWRVRVCGVCGVVCAPVSGACRPRVRAGREWWRVLGGRARLPWAPACLPQGARLPVYLPALGAALEACGALRLF